jgi:hypothetical protein
LCSTPAPELLWALSGVLVKSMKAPERGSSLSELPRSFIKPYDGILIATKAGLRRPSPGQWEPDGRPTYLRDQAINSAGGVNGNHRPVLPFETSHPDVFAIGDVRAGSTMRVAAAVGEGAVVVAEIHSVIAAEPGAMATPSSR